MTEQHNEPIEQLEDDMPAEEAIIAEAAINNDLTVEEQLVQALEQVAQIKEQMLREQAETQNIRKRLQRDVENARKFALERFVSELLPVVDNLDRAISTVASDEVIKPFLEGVELTRKSFLDVLAKHQVLQVDPLGEPFNPELHEAVAMVPNPAMEPNSVMDVMQKGYTLNGRLLRAAMVAVTKAP